ncbi:MAG: hypothetical protein ACJ72W_02300 [Actinoallomurus sp.]
MTERDLPDRGQPAPPEEVVHPDPLPDTAPGIEEPEADFIEQHLDADGEEEGSEELPPVEELPLDANEADAIEQRITARVDEDADEGNA